jgi:8-oxo-dGTP pyrophosphatase MutT (NUDIX family)
MVALTLHLKLNKWLQLGGHADNDTDLCRVAIRETKEESGLKQLTVVSVSGQHVQLFPNYIETKSANYDFDVNGHLFTASPNVIPFDLDAHTIPVYKKIPRHIHYDVRYLIIAKDKQLTISDESQDLQWFSLSHAKRVVGNDEAMLRQIRKLECLREMVLDAYQKMVE